MKLISKVLRMEWHVLNGSLSFTRHPHVYPQIE